jgi:hypothetical protein
MFAISAALFFRAAFLDVVFWVLFRDINANFAVKQTLCPLKQTEQIMESLIMPISPHPVNKLFCIEAILQIIVPHSGPPKPQIGTLKQLTKSINLGFWGGSKAIDMIQKRSFRTWPRD